MKNMLMTLPWDVFTEVILNVAPYDTLRVRCVCRALKNVLDSSDVAIRLVRYHFPRARESRFLRALVEKGDRTNILGIDWAYVFRRLVRRYYHIGNAKFWRQYSVPMVRRGANMMPFFPMHRGLSYKNIQRVVHYADPLWSFDPEPGLLVYPGPPVPDNYGISQWYMLDIYTGITAQIPFDSGGRVVRRVRLSHGVLIFEWCRQLSPSQYVHAGTSHDIRLHCATAMDVVRSVPWNGVYTEHVGGQNARFPWRFDFRGEWRIEWLNPRPDSECDRMFSDHNATHYIAYILKTRGPNRIRNWEAVKLWDIRPEAMVAASAADKEPGYNLVNARCPLVRELTANDLRFYFGRQGASPDFMSIRLDDRTWDEQTRSVCGQFYITEEIHPWMNGPHRSTAPTRVHGLFVTGMPLTGIGPEWYLCCGDPNFASAPGGGHDIAHGLCQTGPHTRQLPEPEPQPDADAGSSLWDILGSDSDSEVDHGDDVSAPRRTRPNARNPPTHANAQQDGTGSAGSGCYEYVFRPLTARQVRRLRGEHEPTDDELMERDLAETWPGRPPCWRHDEYPRFNLAQVFDAAAGVRIIAQSDIHLAPYSRSAKPILRVESDVEAAYSAAGYKDNRDEGQSWEFHESMWSQLMCRHIILGDERWIVGEAPDNKALTIGIF